MNHSTAPGQGDPPIGGTLCDFPLSIALIDHDCETAAYAELAGLRNGAWLATAQQASFHGLITPGTEGFRNRGTLESGIAIGTLICTRSSRGSSHIGRDSTRAGGLDFLSGHGKRWVPDC